MKRSFLCVLCFLGGAASFGVIGTFFGYSVATSNQPAVFIRNLSNTDIPQIRIETDVGESYDVGALAAGASRRVNISGRDKLAWIVAITRFGEERKSQQIYVTSQGVLVGVITDGVSADYAP